MDEKIIELVKKLVMEELSKSNLKRKFYMVPIGVSARHVHLTQQDVETLFGKGHSLTKKTELMGGQFAANEQVTIVGARLRAIENIRVLGPVRAKSQVEISKTDTFKLGISAPIRESGKTQGSAAIAIIGPKGSVYLEEGCIVAQRHIHMSPKDAQEAGLKDEDIVSVHVENERETVFKNVKIRVDKSYTLEMHIDADEANGAGIKNSDSGIII
ncbi:MAG: phosphate propanoyltransferase [Proteocatella sp.]